jgi:hypothetical protein
MATGEHINLKQIGTLPIFADTADFAPAGKKAVKLPAVGLSFMSTTSIFWPARNRLRLLHAYSVDWPKAMYGTIARIDIRICDFDRLFIMDLLVLLNNPDRSYCAGRPAVEPKPMYLGSC